MASAAQCGYSDIFLPIRFCVKSILVNLEFQIFDFGIPICAISNCTNEFRTCVTVRGGIFQDSRFIKIEVQNLNSSKIVTFPHCAVL